MSEPLKVLIVEDSEDDALLVMRELAKGGYGPDFLRVETEEAMSDALREGRWDVVVSDYVMPHFSGLDALRTLRESRLDLPFIVVSGKIGEDTAVAAMRAGADDYILKQNMARLAEAVRRELKEAEVRRGRRRAEAVTAALLETALATGKYLNWDTVLEKVAELVNRLVSGEWTAVFMLEDGVARPLRVAGAPEDVASRFHVLSVPLSEAPAFRMVMDSKECLAADAESAGRLFPRRMVEELGIGSVVVAPVMSREGVSGFLCANFRDQPGPRVVEIMKGVAGQLGIAYENSRLYEESANRGVELARKVETLKALSEIDRLILSTLDKETMLYKAGVQIRRLIGADAGGLCLTGEDGNYRVEGGWGMEFPGGRPVGARECSFLAAVKPHKTAMRIDLGDLPAPDAYDNALMAAGIRSDMHVPVVSKGRTAGFLFLGSRRVAGFSMEDVHAAENFANQIGIALENTKLVADLEELVVGVVKAMASAIDAKSPWTKGHSERVTAYSEMIAREMGMDEHDIERLRLAGLLHDVGKIGTSDRVLNKPGKLTAAEFDVMRRHPGRGAEILASIKQFADIIPGVRCHHERLDGQGYPDGLKGDEIPMMARIIFAADSYDAMTARRPYRPACSREFAIREMERCTGTQFDQAVVAAFLKVLARKKEEEAA